MDLRKTAVIFLCTINCLAFVTEKKRTYCAERAQILHITHSSLILCFCSYVEQSAFMKLFHLVPSKSSPSAGCSWFTLLQCTLRVSVQYVSFYCNLWFTYCVVNRTPFLAFICCSIRVLVVYIVYGRSTAIFIPIFFILCHNSSF
jgi:hypothetical protein